MFSRLLRVKLKPEGAKGIGRTVEDEIVPVMKKFAGFTGQILMVASDGKEAVGISMWDCKENAEAYKKEGAAVVLKALEKHFEGKQELRTYDVVSETFGKLSGRRAA